MQLLTMLTSATLNDFNISLSVISPDTDASGSCVRLQDTGQVRSSLRQVINIELTGSPCASRAHSLELMMAIQFSTGTHLEQLTNCLQRL